MNLFSLCAVLLIYINLSFLFFLFIHFVLPRLTCSRYRLLLCLLLNIRFCYDRSFSTTRRMLFFSSFSGRTVYIVLHTALSNLTTTIYILCKDYPHLLQIGELIGSLDE